MLLAILLLAAAGYGAISLKRFLTVEEPPVMRRMPLPVPSITGCQVELHVPEYFVTSEVTAYKDELFAYLMYDYLRERPVLRGLKLLLVFDHRATQNPYRLLVKGQDDLLAAIADVAGSDREWRLVSLKTMSGYESQTKLFTSAYNLPVKQKLNQVSRKALAGYLERFVRFKSSTDPRIRRRIEPIPEPLSSQQAQHLTGDIITIAEFYDLPLEYFIGIGAIENNYMNIRGDLNHSIWKRRPAKDDVVLERRRGRVRVLNDSAGVWQITRETLRFAHGLIQKDSRDYSQLPEHLRPPTELKIDEVNPQVLTTYAGMLLRDLLDRFDGDVMLAVSAYNGGPGRPNLKYGEGVGYAAAHARRIVEQAAALNGESVVEKTWIRP